MNISTSISSLPAAWNLKLSAWHTWRIFPPIISYNVSIHYCHLPQSTIKGSIFQQQKFARVDSTSTDASPILSSSMIQRVWLTFREYCVNECISINFNLHKLSSILVNHYFASHRNTLSLYV
jgi:hypothetical protein